MEGLRPFVKRKEDLLIFIPNSKKEKEIFHFSSSIHKEKHCTVLRLLVFFNLTKEKKVYY